MSTPMSDQDRPLSLLAPGTALDALDPDVTARLVSRRDALRQGASSSTAVAAGLGLATVPLALAALARDAFGQALPAAVVGVLNFALTLEYLESEFYNRGVAATGLIPAMDRAIFTRIQNDENAHVAYLKQTLGAAAIPKPTFDYSGGNGSGNGPYADVFTNYTTFKALSQAFEDTGVRAYKGQAPLLNPYKDVLVAALTIHSVEGRHAAEVRRLRGDFQDTAPHKGWITLNLTDVPGSQPNYAGEENTVQAGVNVAAAIANLVPAPAVSASEAFDEPLTREQVLKLVDPFIVG